MADNLELENLLIKEFGEFDFDIQGNLIVLQKLCELCDKHKLGHDELVAHWVSYTCSNSQVINEENLKEFERKKLLNVGKTVPRKSSTPYRPNTYTVNTINQANCAREDEEDMLCAYATTPQSKEHIKRLKETPEDSHISKRLAMTSRFESPAPSSSGSPVAISPFIATPSAKYESRANKGDVVACYGISEHAGIDWKGTKQRLAVRSFNDECNVRKPYKHMFQKLQEKADVLNDMINTLSNEMKDNVSLGDFESITTQSQEDVSLCGRICCDSVGRMNSKSVVLEGSREASGGHRIPVDLTTVKNYSLFPGQIVSIQGRNMTGSRIFPSSICMGTKLPFYSASRKDAVIDEGHLSVYITCGPYATCDETLSYTPLYDLLGVITRESPDLLIMLGPFVDSKQPLIEKGEIEESFEDLFKHCLEKIHGCVKQLNTQVVCVPSQRDVFHHFVYPQPPFTKDPTSKSDKIQMFSDPCTLMINDVCFGVTSTDILFHLGGEEVSSVRSDRLGRLAGHLLLQQCYYPLHPTSQDVNLDYERFENYGFMPVTPDVLIVPSDLRYFVKDVDGCLVVNPGRLVKGQAGGTFAKLLVKPKKEPNTNKSSVVTQSIAQVVRI